MAVINSINIETFRGISNLKLDNLAEINILWKSQIVLKFGEHY